MCTNALFWPSLTPPANPVKFFWSKMACTCVPHIVLHVSCRTRTSGGYFRPSEVRFRAKIPLSSHWFYNVKTQKTQFLQNRAWEMAEIENIHCPICTQPIPSSWQNGLPPALATSMQRGELYVYNLHLWNIVKITKTLCWTETKRRWSTHKEFPLNSYLCLQLFHNLINTENLWKNETAKKVANYISFYIPQAGSISRQY